ncbi:PREDICTED: C-C motif chemokine 3-like [Dipodomys ordii]|uniref:C-C motif chemokine n=1 Tax=Dipodomys ordii TaxID=10020 RepID=A0A1S3EW96_DIPOR|nr:PREDICTED: C-C motif chemokine 3-like [Dipodomys ordii]
MKGLLVFLFVLLCTTSLCSCEKDKIYTPPTCCFSYVSQPIPLNHMASYYKTSGACLKEGIIFLTKKGRHICANPSDAWVQKHIQKLDMNP